MIDEERIHAYAELLIQEGLNVQKGQTVLITCPVECASFARLCAEKAYAAGCREVVMNWNDDALTRLKYLHADNAVFDEFPSWRADFYNGYAKERAAYLVIDSEDPESLSGVNPDRIRRSKAASGKAIRYFRDASTADLFPWCVASVPSTAWARKVFPDVDAVRAEEMLWDAILKSSRVFPGGDPIQEWQEHSATLKKRVEVLNRYRFRLLKYRNSLGTDLTVELPEGHIWEGGSEKSADGTVFSANIPTEEIFTAPKLDGVNGVVFASRPLVLNGDIADHFSFHVENGKITGISAVKGLELLKATTSVDEGASYFGEIALVPCNSPISNSGILFYNTLFDENASCHIAFGSSYPCVEGGNAMTPEERKAHGLNDSIVHVDFMVGTPDLSIMGVTDSGEEIPVFIDGNFAF